MKRGMKANELNTTRMFSSVQVTLEEHETDVNKIPALVKASGELDTIITGIAAQLEITALQSGAVANKDNLLGVLAPAANEVAAALHAYATETGDDELAAQVDLSVTDIAQGRPATVVARCTNIASLGSENLDSLSDYNITQAKLTALTKKIAAFEKQVPKPRQGVAKKAAANKAARRFLKQGRDLLNRRIDKLMVQFRETQPELYAEYRTARKIVNSPGAQNDRGTKAEAANAAATNGSNGVATAPETATTTQNGHSEAAETTAEPVARVA
jgi:hypothetical protein